MFITFEGIEGSGKGTVLSSLAAWLQSSGRRVLQTREPGGSALGRDLRSILLDSRNKDLSPQAELFLYLADRAQHVSTVIRPALERGELVLSDRYADSTIVYQGYARGLGPDLLHQLNDVAVSGLWPDLTLILDLDARIGLERAQRRNARTGKAVTEGRFEAEALDFHLKIRQGYLDWAARFPERLRVIDASGSREEVLDKIKSVVEEYLR